jgi:hypothetical protein
MSDAIRIVYRVASNKWNLSDIPWSGAVGIEEVRLWEDGSEVYAVPPLLCWLTRGEHNPELAHRIVDFLNADIK